MQYFLFRGNRIAYRKAGQGDCCVLLHGFCEHSAMWSSLIEDLQNKFTVIAPDFYGFGASDQCKQALSMSLLAEMTAALLRHENLSASVLVGHSMGGYVMMECLAQVERPEFAVFGSTKKIILLNTHVMSDNADKRQSRAKAIRFVERHGSNYYLRSLILNLFHPNFIEKHEDLVEAMIDDALKTQTQMICGYLKAMADRKDHSETLSAYSGFVLLLGGRDDETFPIDNMLQQATYAAKTEIHLLSEVAHMCHLESKSQTMAIVNNFLASIRS